MKAARLRPEAIADLDGARAWYEAQREGLGVALTAEVARVIDSACARPSLFRVVARPGFRRGLVRRFPYAVFFVDTDDEVIVLAILHQAMDPSRWRARFR